MTDEVALLAEGVDRNNDELIDDKHHTRVALLAEGVDRNTPVPRHTGFAGVALLAEGVDRNSTVGSQYRGCTRRPPRGGRG